LQSVSIKKTAQKDRNFANSNNNKNYGINLHNKNNSVRNKKTKMSIVCIKVFFYSFQILYSYRYSKPYFFLSFLEH